MSANHFGHVDIRVTDLAAAHAFYARLLPQVGFPTETSKSTSPWKVFSAEGALPSAPWFGFVEDPEHVANRNRIAFWVQSRAEVDRLAELVRATGGRDVSGPKEMPQYAPSYYAVFFADPSGNCLEVVHCAD